MLLKYLLTFSQKYDFSSHFFTVSKFEFNINVSRMCKCFVTMYGHFKIITKAIHANCVTEYFCLKYYI